MSELLCLGRFEAHSYYPWWWQKDKKMYYRECSLLGCSFSETSENLKPIGKTIFVGESKEHLHDWTVWQSTADQFGLIRNPPWQHKRECNACGVKELAEKLEREVE